MPGTIQVTVLGFVDLPSSLSSSSISIKVSMGKREFQTWEEGDFSFPLGTLREKLIITLYDAEGNQISETGVEAISIVEKRLWDDYFPLEGGGHVHMKLQFTLSEVEQDRIRMMRESASMKKRNELLNSSLQRVDTTSTVSNTAASYNREVSANGVEVAAQASTVSNHLSPPSSGNGIKETSHAAQNDTNTSEVASSTAPVPQEVEIHGTEVTETPSVSVRCSLKEDSIRLESSDISEVTLSTASDSNEVDESMYPKQDSSPVEISDTSAVTSSTAQEPEGIKGDSELYTQRPVEVISSQCFSVDESVYPKQDSSLVKISDTSEVISSTAQEPQGNEGDSESYARGPVEVINSQSLSVDESPIEVSTVLKRLDASDVTLSTTPVTQEIEAHATKLYPQGPVKVIKTQSPSFRETVSPNDVSTHVESNKKLAFSEQKEGRPLNPENPAPVERSLSNVRKMISAFESNRPQDIRPDYKPASVKTPPSKVVAKAPLKEPHAENVKTDIPISTHESSVTNPYFQEESLKKLSAEQVHLDVTNSSLNDETVVHDKESENEDEESPELIGVPTIDEATVSGQMLHEEHLVRPQPNISRSDSKEYMMEYVRETHSGDSDMSNYQRDSNEEKNPDLHGVSTDKEATVSGQMLVEHIATQEPSISRSDSEDYTMECVREIHSDDLHISNHQRDSNQEEEAPDLHRVSTDKEETVSGQMLVEHIAGQQPSNSQSDSNDSGGNSGIMESATVIHSKESNITTSHQRDSNDTLRSIGYHGDKIKPHESCAWIFPEEGRDICVTTSCGSETTSYQGRTDFSAPQHGQEQSLQGAETFCTPLESNRDNSENVENPRGPVGQAIKKVAIMVGVGTLILLSRQWKNRQWKKSPCR